MILVAIGANLPDASGAHPLQTCRAAVEALRALPGLRLHALSRWYRTEPVPPSGQPPYVNGVARLEARWNPADPGAASGVDPAWLLARLQAIEHAAGRVRGAANAARTLDLDIVAMGAAEAGLIRDWPDPVLPHPRAHLRGFVLRPLLDVAPGWVHPRLGMSARALLEALPPGGVERL